MKAPHLLRVALPAARFAPLFAALRAAGLRYGWLELPAQGASEPAPLPEGLAAAADLGALRAVAVGAGRSVAVKPLRGAAVVRDLLREHFQGCTVVLVLGDGGGDLPLLEPDAERDDTWRVAPPGAAVRVLSGEALVAALRRPHPFG
ncbi:MAG TPA: hypothetical protein VGE98_17005 [Thermoanaerobaculia bacterium]